MNESKNQPSAEAAPTDQNQTEQIPATPPKQRLRDRMFSFRSLIAVSLASLIIGGLGGTTAGVLASNFADRGPGGHHRGQLGPRGFDHGNRGPGGFAPGGNGWAPPGSNRGDNGQPDDNGQQPTAPQPSESANP
jgi:hypothetical protein